MALCIGLCTAAQADGLVRVEQTIFGMDCAPCAYGMQKNLGKLQGVSKVDVSIEQGVAVIDFAANSPVTLAEIHDVVLHGGLTPEKIVLTVQGSVTQRGDKLVLTDGSKEDYVLTGLSPAQAASLKPGTTVLVHGEATGTPGESPITLNVQDVKTL
jgi:copper chaperone CopZ